jgi:hypothetical protein
MYRLQVTKFVDNPNYDKEMDEYKSRSTYQLVDHPMSRLEERNLDVTVTDEEYKAIKKAVLETFV